MPNGAISPSTFCSRPNAWLSYGRPAPATWRSASTPQGNSTIKCAASPGAIGVPSLASRRPSPLALRPGSSAVAFKQNLATLPALIAQCAARGVQIFSVFLGSRLGRGSTVFEQIIDPWSWRRFIQELKGAQARGAFGETLRLIVEQGFAFCDERIVDPLSLAGRGAGCTTLLDAYDYLIVRADGNVYQCVFFMHEGPALGNVREHSLAVIVTRARTEARYPRFSAPGLDCGACARRGLCRGGCRGYAQLYREDWHRADPRCEGPKPSPATPTCPSAPLPSSICAAAASAVAPRGRSRGCPSPHASHFGSLPLALIVQVAGADESLPPTQPRNDLPACAPRLPQTRAIMGSSGKGKASNGQRDEHSAVCGD